MLLFIARRGSPKRRPLAVRAALAALVIVAAANGEVVRAQSASSTTTEADSAVDEMLRRCKPALDAKDNLKGVACTRELADTGNAFAQMVLGLFYANGEVGLAPDPRQGAVLAAQVGGSRKCGGRVQFGRNVLAGKGRSTRFAHVERLDTKGSGRGKRRCSKVAEIAVGGSGNAAAAARKIVRRS